MTKKRIAVVGCGCSGLTCIKSCLEEGLEPVCFEKTNDVGGLWRYSETAEKASVYRSAVFNTSKEMTCFSDFPVPPQFPPFLPHDYFMCYLRMYADKFNLLRHIRFNVEVTKVEPAANYDQTGRWNVTWGKGCEKDAESKKIDSFDGVMICTGHHWNPYKPSFRGLEKFRGRVLHSSEYRHGDSMVRKRVLVVGEWAKLS